MNSPVTELRLSGGFLVGGALVLAVLSAVVPSGILALALLFLAPPVWFLQWKYDAVLNLGPAVALAGLLFLLVDAASVGPLEVSAFIGLCGLLLAAFAPRLADRLE